MTLMEAMKKPLSMEKMRQVKEVLPIDKIMEEMATGKKLRHLIILSSDDLSIKESYIDIVTKYKGEEQDIILDEYIKLCKEDNLL